MPKKKYLVTLDDDERTQLEDLLHSGTHATRKVTRARILLKAAEGIEDSAIAAALSVGRATVERTRRRFVEEGLGALEERPRPGTLPKLDAKAQAFVHEVIRDKPVVLFALEWCEFCWAVRKLFARLGIAHESVDLDSVAFQQDALGVKVRDVLRAEHAPTIPQIFVGGERIGGCTELFDAMRSGDLQKRLDAAGVDYDKRVALDPYTLLPNWVHPREPA